MLKYSRQREAIKTFLMDRKDHPTADVVYAAVREKFPNISLGTVYRNLALLADLGEINRVVCENDASDHFDFDTSPHHHFCCKECGAVIDVPLQKDAQKVSQLEKELDVSIDDVKIIYYGTCNACQQKKVS